MHQISHQLDRTDLGDVVYIDDATHLNAMPEQRARQFNATLSPSRMFRTGPRTVAHRLTGLNVSPSSRCHSTLTDISTAQCDPRCKSSRAVQLSEDLVEERDTRQHALALAEQSSFSHSLANHETTVVKTRRIFLQP